MNYFDSKNCFVEADIWSITRRIRRQWVLYYAIILKASFAVYKVVKGKAEPEIKIEKIK